MIAPSAKAAVAALPIEDAASTSSSSSQKRKHSEKCTLPRYVVRCAKKDGLQRYGAKLKLHGKQIRIGCHEKTSEVLVLNILRDFVKVGNLKASSSDAFVTSNTKIAKRIPAAKKRALLPLPRPITDVTKRTAGNMSKSLATYNAAVHDRHLHHIATQQPFVPPSSTDDDVNRAPMFLSPAMAVSPTFGYVQDAQIRALIGQHIAQLQATYASDLRILYLQIANAHSSVQKLIARAPELSSANRQHGLDALAILRRLTNDMRCVCDDLNSNRQNHAAAAARTAPSSSMDSS
eukprot:g2575.t1